MEDIFFACAINLHILELLILLQLHTTLMDNDFLDILTTTQKPQRHLIGIEALWVGNTAASEVSN